MGSMGSSPTGQFTLVLCLCVHAMHSVSCQPVATGGALCGWQQFRPDHL